MNCIANLKVHLRNRTGNVNIHILPLVFMTLLELKLTYFAKFNLH